MAINQNLDGFWSERNDIWFFLNILYKSNKVGAHFVCSLVPAFAFIYWQNIALIKNWPKKAFVCPIFSRILTECWDLLAVFRKTPYLYRIQENTER